MSLALLCAGCMHDLPETLPQLQLDSFGPPLRRDGVRIAIDPITDASRSAAYFGEDLLDLGVLPVVVSVANESGPQSLLLDPSSLRVEGVTASVVGAELPVDADPTKKAADVNTLVMLVPVVGLAAMAASVPMQAARLQDTWNASVVRHEMARHQLRATTLAPGEEEHGIVFVLLGDDAKRPDDEITLVIELADFAGTPMPSFELPISLAGRHR